MTRETFRVDRQVVKGRKDRQVGRKREGKEKEAVEKTKKNHKSKTWKRGKNAVRIFAYQ